MAPENVTVPILPAKPTLENLRQLQRMLTTSLAPFPSSFSGWEPKRLWSAQADGGYEETAFAEGFDSRQDGRSLIAADLDGDSDQELVMLSRPPQPLQLFENVGPPGRALELELVPRSGARDAEGAEVRVEGLGVFPVVLARGYASAVAPRVHVGLGTRESVSVEVRWRSGQRESFSGLKAGRRYELTEGAARPTREVELLARHPEAPLSWPARLGDLGVPRGETMTVVQLFTRGCKPCAAEAPELFALSQEGWVRVEALGIVAPDDDVEKAAASLGIKTSAHVLPESAALALERGGELPLPLLLVYGADGKLERVLPGPAQLRAVLEELRLRKEPPSPP